MNMTSLLTSARRSAGAAILAALFALSNYGATIWNGPNLTYTKSTSTPTDTILAGKVVLKRNGSGPLYNTALGEKSPGTGSPKGITFAFGDIGNFSSLTFQSLDSLRNGNLAARILNQQMVAHIVDGDIYFPITFKTWGTHGQGGGTVSYVRATAAAVTPPTVSLISPANGTQIPGPASFMLSANASGGTITGVSFFNGATLLGTVQSPPYTLAVNGLGTGLYSFTAVATTADSSATSGVVHVTVTAPEAPTVTLTSPAEGATFTAPASVTLSANAGGGTITGVSFFNGTTPLETVTTAPYSVTVNNLVAGAYSFTAVASTANSSATSSVVHVSVNAPVTTVTLTSPTEGATFTAPAILNLSAAASGGAITGVSFFNESILLGSVSSAPYNLTVTNLAAGSYTLTAVASTADVSSTSGVVHVTVTAALGDVKIGPPGITNNQFAFSYPIDPGQTYLVQSASLIGSGGSIDWTSVSTNTPSGSSADFTEALTTNHFQFFRVGRIIAP